MIQVRVLAALALVLLVAACGSASEAESPPSPPASAPPAPTSGPLNPPPTLGANGPPAAWIETEAGAFWLGYSTYCWKTVCADYMAPSCRTGGDVPEIAVRSGEEVRFHLGFEPNSVVLTFFGTSVEQEELSASATPAWRVQRDGAIAVFSTADGRDASYAACLRYTGDASSGAPVPGGALTVAEALESELDEPLLVEGALVAVADEVRLCSALAESFPPQCGGPSLPVQGLDLETVEGLAREGVVAWAESASVLGTVEDGILKITQTAT
jgi:hypothetical protein